MGYAAALEKAWEILPAAGLTGAANVRFFTDEFRIDPSSHTVAQLSGQRPQDVVADNVPIGVIHLFETIDIQQENGERLARSCAPTHLALQVPHDLALVG